MRYPLSALAILSILLLGLPASAAMQAGVAAAVKGSVTLTSGQAVGKKIKSGQKIHLGDTIKTGPDSGMQVLLLDETVFTLGANSEMVIDEFVYKPQDGEGKIDARLVKGAFRFISGKVARQDPEKMNVKVPAGTIGVRGTIVLANIDPAESSALVILAGPGANNNTGDAEGSIDVSNMGVTRDVVRTGWGVEIPDAGSPPTEPFQVPQSDYAAFQFDLSPQHGGGQQGRGPDGSQGDGPKGDGPKGDRARGKGPDGKGPRGRRPRGRGPRGDGPQGDGPYSEGPDGEGPHGDGPHGDGPHGPPGQGPHGDGPHGPPGQGPYAGGPHDGGPQGGDGGPYGGPYGGDGGPYGGDGGPHGGDGGYYGGEGPYGPPPGGGPMDASGQGMAMLGEQSGFQGQLGEFFGDFHDTAAETAQEVLGQNYLPTLTQTLVNHAQQFTGAFHYDRTAVPLTGGGTTDISLTLDFSAQQVQFRLINFTSTALQTFGGSSGTGTQPFSPGHMGFADYAINTTYNGSGECATTCTVDAIVKFADLDGQIAFGSRTDLKVENAADTKKAEAFVETNRP